MKLLLLPLVLLGALGLSSCGLLRSAIQLPARTLQTVGRSVGFGLEQTEATGEEANRAKVRFEREDAEEALPSVQ